MAHQAGINCPINTYASVPTGFRFHPTDEELVNFYLKKRVSLESFDLDFVIPDVELNKIEPWDLCGRFNMDIMYLSEIYFFSHRDKKFLTGRRTNRATTGGFWKATGRDKAVYSGHCCIGMKKTLVFYKGRGSQSEKTDWIMHEYRLEDGNSGLLSNVQNDGWVVCRIFKKQNVQEKMHQSCSNVLEEQSGTVGNMESSRNSQENFALGHTFLCKKGVENQAPQASFSNLPQLESPKITSSLLGLSCNNFNGSSNVDQEVVSESAFSEGPSMNDFNTKSLCMPECNKAGHLDSELMDWDVFQNSQTNFRDFSNFIVDTLCHLDSGEQVPSECEVDLWNFTR